MTTSSVGVTPGTGKNAATHSITEDAITKEIQRVALSNAAGTDIATATNPMPISVVGKFVDVTLTLDTAAYADGDVLADTQAVADCFRTTDGTGVIQSIQILDEDDQGAAFDLVFLSANNSIGTENAAPSVTDANARDILGRVRVNSSDYIDLGGCKIATLTGVGIGAKAASGTDDMYVAAIARGTPTHTASGIRLRIYVAAD